MTRAHKLLAPALSLSLLAVAFSFDQRGIRWFWAAHPGVALALGAGGAICWGLMLLSHRTHKPSG